VSPVHFVLPNDIDDPLRPSGGNIYDRHIIDGLNSVGWQVHEHAATGDWPHPTPAQCAVLAGALATLPDDALVVVDGLVASAVPEILRPQARRLRLIVLMHMPLGDTSDGRARAAEARVLAAAVGVVTTSRWTARRLQSLYALTGERVHVASPGVDAAPLAPGSSTGARLLSVAAVTHHKGHDVLVDALAGLGAVPFSCVCAGALDRDPAFVDSLLVGLRARGLADRVSFAGALSPGDLCTSYARADLLVLPSRGDTYGMVVTEALARGIPVVTTDAKGLPEAMGRAPDGSRPGILVPPGDAPALAGVLRRWLAEPQLRERLRDSARGRRATLSPWASTVSAFSAALVRLPYRMGLHSGR
jgi:glycosyltransferase involved in cell wall biosynthesis